LHSEFRIPRSEFAPFPGALGLLSVKAAFIPLGQQEWWQPFFRIRLSALNQKHVVSSD